MKIINRMFDVEEMTRAEVIRFCAWLGRSVPENVKDAPKEARFSWDGPDPKLTETGGASNV